MSALRRGFARPGVKDRVGPHRLLVVTRGQVDDQIPRMGQIVAGEGAMEAHRECGESFRAASNPRGVSGCSWGSISNRCAPVGVDRGLAAEVPETGGLWLLH